MRIRLLSLSRLAGLIAIVAGLGSPASAGETFCVDGTKEWSQAKDLDGTAWKEKGSDDLRLFAWQPVRDDKFLWQPGTELGLVWSFPDALWNGTSNTTQEKLKPLQFLQVKFEPAQDGKPATIGFDRKVVKLTDAGDYRDDLTQTWRYRLQFSDDCQVLSGRITMLKFGETESGLTATTTLLRDK